MSSGDNKDDSRVSLKDLAKKLKISYGTARNWGYERCIEKLEELRRKHLPPSVVKMSDAGVLRQISELSPGYFLSCMKIMYQCVEAETDIYKKSCLARDLANIILRGRE